MEKKLPDALGDIAQGILESSGNENWPDDQTIDGLDLVCTCASHPEQYEVYDSENKVAYFRLRHGCFRVDVPDCGGETIYEVSTKGDGLFYADERQKHLAEAVKLVRRWVQDKEVEGGV